MQKLSNSEVQTFRDCPKKWGFRYPEGLRSGDGKPAAKLGTLVHAGLAGAWKAIQASQATQLGERTREAKVAAAMAISEAYTDLTQEMVGEDSPDPDVATWVTLHALEERSHLLERCVVLMVEQPYSVRVPKENGVPFHGFRHTGILDLVIWDPKEKAVILVDHKVTSRPLDVERRVRLDSQIAGYTHALQILLQEWSDKGALPPGVPGDVAQRVGRVEWWISRSKKPAEPRILKSGMVSAATNQDTTEEAYRKALEDQENLRNKPRTPEQAETMVALAQKAKVWFHVVEHYVDPAEVDRWRHDLITDARRIRKARLLPVMRTRNPGHCSQPWSLPCEYRMVCLNDTPETRSLYTRRDDGESSETEEGGPGGPEGSGSAQGKRDGGEQATAGAAHGRTPRALDFF